MSKSSFKVIQSNSFQEKKESQQENELNEIEKIKKIIFGKEYSEIKSELSSNDKKCSAITDQINHLEKLIHALDEKIISLTGKLKESQEKNHNIIEQNKQLSMKNIQLTKNLELQFEKNKNEQISKEKLSSLIEKLAKAI